MEYIIDVVIPAFNEAGAIQKVLKAIPYGLTREVIVVDNNSTDATGKLAKAAGATVLLEPTRGYGIACLKGIQYLLKKDTPPEIVVFLDADYSDHPDQMLLLVQPIISGGYDMVIGSRALGKREKGAMMPQQLFGNWLATGLIKYLYKTTYTDLGPFRAIRYASLLQLQMNDTNYGWTVEMQLKAAKQKLKVCEVAVDYRKRIGVSKVSGTVKGTIMAGYKIISTIFKYV